MNKRPSKRKIRVYGWHGMRRAASGRGQTREIVAATSQAAAARIAGFGSPRQMFNLRETGNEQECAVAMGKIGVVFWCPIDAPRPRVFVADEVK